MRVEKIPGLAVVAVFLSWQALHNPVLAADAEIFVAGLHGLEALAFSPQGFPFAGLRNSSGSVLRIVSPNRTHWLTETGGIPTAFAFDPQGDLIVADRQRGAIYRVTPWGSVTTIADWLGAPNGVACAADGSIFFTDTERGAVYRLTSSGSRTQIASGIAGARGIAVDLRTGELYVSAASKKIVKIALGAAPSEFASLPDPGEPAGLALDQEGKLYVAQDGAGKVSVLDPEGRLVTSYQVPGARPVSLAFGGLDLKTLYVAEASRGMLYRIPLSVRCQRLPWEPATRLRITSPANGDILNRHDGELTPQGLRITVEGKLDGSEPVRVNGVPATLANGQFRATILLSRAENKLVAETASGARHAITVYWDRNSVPRYRVSTDDNILFLKDIAEHAATYRSIFDNPYLAFWRAMHHKYGIKVHHNIYYETPGFNLSRMPAKFKAEWQQNAGWMRLSFHARANDPDRPYVHAPPEKVLAEYRAVTREIERFAGKEALGRFVTVHWGEITEAAATELRREGVLGLVGYFRTAAELPSVSYYLRLNQTLHMMKRDYWRDPRNGLYFVRHDIVINTVPLHQIDAFLETIASDPHQSEIMELMIHEQYFYPDYKSYEPDFRERVERAIQFVHRRGYRPVFYEEGFLGSTP